MSAPVPDPRITAAQARATAARARLTGTIETLKQRVSPQALAQDAADTIKDKGRNIANAAAERPVAVAAVAGGIVLVLARGRIAGWLRRATAAVSKSFKAESTEGPTS